MLSQIADLEEKCKKIMYEKKLNKELFDNWNVKVENFEIDENRKYNAAQLILNSWKQWKISKTQKKPKSKPKPA